MIKLNDLTKKLNIDSIDEVIGKGGIRGTKTNPIHILGWCDYPSSSSSSEEEEEEGSNNGGSGD